MCPQLGCPGGKCGSTDVGCTTGQEVCAPPGTPLGCGFCNNVPGTCANDTDCKAQGAAFVCNPIPCSCHSEKQCEMGCKDDTTCGDGTRCDVPSARCAAITCTGGTQCPANFHCASSTCTRDECADDRDCDGFCVVGKCFASGR